MGRDLGREVYFYGKYGNVIKRMMEIAKVFPLIHDKVYLKV
jgi:hypothetical protein